MAANKRVNPEQFEKFQAWVLDREQTDTEFDSLGEGIKHLKKRAKSA